MHGASLEWLAPDICVVRAGEGHRQYGDPWSYGVTVRVVDGVAEFHAGLGNAGFWQNYRSQRAVIRTLMAAGIDVRDWTRMAAGVPTT